MNASGEMVEIQAADGQMPAYAVRPDGPGPFPGVVVVMEAFGLNGHIKGVAERIGREGYLTVAPDLYYRQPGAVADYGDLPRALALMSTLDDTKIVEDVRAVVGWLARQTAARADRIGITGFCMGGRVSFLAACHLPLRAAAPFYGGGIGRVIQPSARTPHPPIDAAAGIVGALLVFYGERDAFISADEVALVRERLETLGKRAEVVVYPGAEHGFFCDERASYHPAAAQDAWRRLLRFFEAHLRQ